MKARTTIHLQSGCSFHLFKEEPAVDATKNEKFLNSFKIKGKIAR